MQTNAIRNRGATGRFPPYSRKLLELRQSGQVPSRTVRIVFSWNLAKVYPRIVITDDASEDLNFDYLAGLPVQIVFYRKDAHRVPAIVQSVLKVNPSCLSTFGLDLIDTGNALMIIKHFQDTPIERAA